MTVEQIIQKTEEADFAAWDKKTVKEAVQMKEELAPVLLENLQHYYEQLSDLSWEPDDDEYHRHINGYLLLGEMKETRAYPILLKYMVLPELQLDYAFGDDLVMDLTTVLANTYDGSLEETKALIADTQLYEFARGALVKALGYVCRDGRLAQEEFVPFLRKILKKEQKLDNEGFVICAMETVYDARLYALCPDMRDLMLHGGIALIEYESFLDHLFDYKDAKKEKWIPKASGKLEASIAADGLTAEEAAILNYNAGRNDPCPCGSGKKFKKCCLSKQDALKMKYPGYTVKRGKQTVQSQVGKLDPVLYPSIVGAGDHPGLADYFPREGVDVDLHAYRGMKVLKGSGGFFRTRSEAASRIAAEQLWEAFEGFQKICKEHGYRTAAEYDRIFAVHYFSGLWLNQLADLLKERKDSRAETVEKWL